MLEKMQKDHLEKLEIRLKQKQEGERKQPLPLKLGAQSISGSIQNTSASPAIKTPRRYSSIAENRAKVSSELESGKDEQKISCENTALSMTDEGSAEISDDKVQLQRLKRRLEVALREAEREKQAVSVFFDKWNTPNIFL